MSGGNNNMNDTTDAVKQEILTLSDKIFDLMPVILPSEWFSSDLTVAQLRIMLFLHMRGANRMTAIASELAITLPTATGIVDNLVKKSLVERETDEQDRRAVVCRLSPSGQMFIDMIWVLGKNQMRKLLDGLTDAELGKCLEVANILYRNALRNNIAEESE